MNAVVLMNAAAGTDAGEHREVAVREALTAAGVDADVRPTEGARLGHAARSAADGGAGVVVAAGGDGTVSAVAGALGGSGAVLGVLPTGTLNHFARDLGVPQRLEDAARLIARGATAARAVDVGEVNERRFINNASIGLYPHIVSNRQRQQERLGRGKWLAMAVAAASVFRRYPVVNVTLTVEGRTVHTTTPFVFVGNNRYEMNLLAQNGRKFLDGGALSVYFTHHTGRFGLLRLALRGLFSRLEQAKDFESLSLPALTVDTRKKTLRIALDGEVTRLTPPLKFRVLPAALRVIAPGAETSDRDGTPEAAEVRARDAVGI